MSKTPSKTKIYVLYVRVYSYDEGKYIKVKAKNCLDAMDKTRKKDPDLQTVICKGVITAFTDKELEKFGLKERKIPEFVHKRQITGIGTGRINPSWSRAWDEGRL